VITPRKIALCSSVSIFICTLMGNGIAHAQQAQIFSEGQVGEIIVTARKREESLQEIPMAVTAFSGDTLKEKNVTNSFDLPLLTPGLTVRSTGARQNSDFFIRGQGPTFGTSSAVVTYFAEVPNFGGLGAGASAIDFVDIASVQVAKGPQGTLFGRSTTGGAVLVEPGRPSAEFGGFAEATLGNLHYRQAAGAVNIPIVGDQLMLRVAGQIERREGFTVSSTTGQKLDDRRRESYRIGLLFQPSDAFSSYFLLYGQNVNEAGTGNINLYYNSALPLFNTSATGAGRATIGFVCSGLNAATPANIPGCISTRVAFLDQLTSGFLAEDARLRAGGKDAIRSTPTYPGAPAFSRSHSQVLQNITSANIGATPLGDITLKNIFATPRVMNAGLSRNFPNSAGLHAVNTAGVEIIGNVPVITKRSGTTDFFDHIYNETQLSGSSDLVDWLVGYSYERNFRPIDFGQVTVYPLFNTAFSPVLGKIEYLNQLVVNRKDIDRGIFGQATIHLDRWVPGLNFTAGYRRSSASRDSFNATIVAGPTPSAIGPLTPVPHFSEKASTYNFSIDYQVNPDILVYATTRKGYKPGGLNGAYFANANPIPGSRPTYSPEILKDVELGLKVNWRSGNIRGRSNIAAYHQWYSNIQRFETLIRPEPPFDTNSQTNNIAGAKLYGVELENEIQIGQRWTLTANYSYINAKYNKYLGTTTSIFGVATPNIETPYTVTPKHQLTLGARFLAIQSEKFGDIALSGQYYYQSAVWLDDKALVTAPLTFGRQPGYGNLNLRAEWSNFMGYENLQASLFVRNATNEVYLTSVQNQADTIGVATAVYSEPRTYGIQLRYRFGGG
jgi:iron complex outermembrane receptor protein